MRKAVFCDRDGTICKEKGPIGDWAEIELFPEVYGAFARLKRLGYEIIVVSNQGAVAKGLITLEQVTTVNGALLNHFEARGLPLLGSVFCPHHPGGIVAAFAVVCSCRKPAPGLILSATARFDIDLAKSIMIGDNITDTIAGNRAGCGASVLVATGHGSTFSGSTQAPVLSGLQELPNWIECTLP